MVASTDIKFYVHTNTNAPQLDNVQGSMIAVLDAVLVNGFGSQAVSSITATGTTATVTFGAAHNYMQYQVIRIAGATQAEYNGQRRILTVPSTTTLTFKLAAAPSAIPATGTITCDLPPLGWSLPFTSTGKRAYKSPTAGSPYLRVVDAVDPRYNTTYAKYAKVGIVEGMTDIDTMLGAQVPYDSAKPTKNWVGTGSGASVINGWAKWFYATNGSETVSSSKNSVPATGARAWVIVGNADTFYIFNKSHNESNTLLIASGFGKLNNLSKINANPYFLAARDDYTAANDSTYFGYSALTTTDTYSTVFILRNYKNQAVASSGTSRVISMSSIDYCGFSSSFAAPDADISVFSSEYLIMETNTIPRGTVPILRWLYQYNPYAHLLTFSENGRMCLACNCVSQTYEGQILFDLGAL